MIPAARPLPQLERTNWQAQWRDCVRDGHELLALLGLEELAPRLSPAAQAQFALRVPRSFVARMQHGNPNDPLLRQVLPLVDEDTLAPGFSLDAVGDAQATAGTGLIRKYQGRALLIATGSCAVNCRYCFRRHFPYSEQTAAREGWAAAIAAIAEDPSLHEVILSGGDPLSLSDAKLTELTRGLARIPHIRRMRIHTRLPVVLPDRIDAGFIQWIEALPWAVTVVIHANHAQEFDASVDAAIARLRRAGCTVLNQAVLLRGVNDSTQALIDLCERGFAAGVLPYYLHLLDRVQGAAHFEVEQAQALQLHAALHSALPGYLVPRLVREIAGAVGKTHVRD